MCVPPIQRLRSRFCSCDDIDDHGFFRCVLALVLFVVVFLCRLGSIGRTHRLRLLLMHRSKHAANFVCVCGRRTWFECGCGATWIERRRRVLKAPRRVHSPQWTRCRLLPASVRGLAATASLNWASLERPTERHCDGAAVKPLVSAAVSQWRRNCHRTGHSRSRSPPACG